MPERFSPDQLFAWVAHWRGLLNEDQLLDLEDQYEQILDEGDYVSLAELAVRGGFIKEAQRDGLQRWYRLAEERFDGTWYARQLMEDGVPQAEIDAAFARQEKQFVTDKRIVPLLDILIQRSVITPGMAADLEPPPEELDDEGDDSDSGEHYDDGAAPSDVAVSNWSETQMHRAAGGLLDMVMSATEQESPTRIRRRAAEELGLEPDDADEDEEVPDLLKMQEQMRSEPAGPAKVTPSGRVVAAPPPVVLPGGDDRSLTAALAQLKIGGTPDPGSTKGIPFGEKFELYREIRRERSGIFYLARQTNLGRLVVVRLLTEELSRLPGVPERYRELATAAGRLAHPHLAQVFEVGVGNDGRPFSVLEYLPGQPLSEVLRRGQRIGVRHAVQLILSIAKALDEASKQNLLHGDLSLADLFLASDGQIKVRLPGYVDLWPAEQRAARRDPFCTAPELDTEPDATPQSDMYALGVCFYTVLTQRLPLRGENRETTRAQHRNRIPARPSQIAGREIPPGIDTIVLRMLQKDPADRYKSWASVVAALDHELEVLTGALTSGAAAGDAGDSDDEDGDDRGGAAGRVARPRRRRRRARLRPPSAGGGAAAGADGPPASSKRSGRTRPGSGVTPPPPASGVQPPSSSKRSGRTRPGSGLIQPPTNAPPPAGGGDADGGGDEPDEAGRPRRRRGRRRFRR